MRSSARNPSPWRDRHFIRLANLMHRYAVRTLRRADPEDIGVITSGRGCEHLTITFKKVIISWLYQYNLGDIPFHIGLGPYVSEKGTMDSKTGRINIHMPMYLFDNTERAFETKHQNNFEAGCKYLSSYFNQHSFKHTFVHEMIHLLDLARGVIMDSTTVVQYNKDVVAYYNSPIEMNAHAQTAFSDLLPYLKGRVWELREFLHSFSSFFGRDAKSDPYGCPQGDLPFYKLTKKNQRRLIKRAAMFWSDFYSKR